ncbi:SEL1-like repeat protein [Caulobacter sp. DWR3-1-2]|uniref:SEL1-like repeat protein n=1 Tax=Caulobacter sp. DWR3-1-2 TaxID=2804647 RepID=UPI003CF50F58
MVASMSFGFAWSAPPKTSRTKQEPPSLYFWRNERPHNQLQFETVEGYLYNMQERQRRVVPTRTASAYSAAQLRTWAQRGDLIANFIIAGQLRGSLNAQTINSQQDEAALARSLPFYERAAQPSPCAGILASEKKIREFLGCSKGLPEAQYVLAVCYKYGLLGCRQDDALSLKYCTLSKGQVYIPSENLCRSED